MGRLHIQVYPSRLNLLEAIPPPLLDPLGGFLLLGRDAVAALWGEERLAVPFTPAKEVLRKRVRIAAVCASAITHVGK